MKPAAALGAQDAHRHRGPEWAFYEMPRGDSNAETRNYVVFGRFYAALALSSQVLAAEAVRIRLTQPKNVAALVLLVPAMRPTRFERNDLHLPRQRAIDRSHTATRHGVKRFERILRRMT
jgi:hypothetical protein